MEKRQLCFGFPALNDTFVHVGECTISATLGVLVNFAQFFDSWFSFASRAGTNPSPPYHIFLEDMDEAAVIFLMHAAHYSMPNMDLIDEPKFFNLLSAFGRLQVKTPTLKELLQCHPERMESPLSFYTLRVISLAAEHGFKKILTDAFAVRCVFNFHHGDHSLVDAQVTEAFLANKFPLLSEINVEQLVIIINNYDGQSPNSRAVMTKLSLDLLQHPHLLHVKVLAKAKDIHVEEILDRLLTLPAPYFLRMSDPEEMRQFDVETLCVLNQQFDAALAYHEIGNGGLTKT